MSPTSSARCEEGNYLAVCTNKETRGQSIARLKLQDIVDISKPQASFNNLFYITNIENCNILLLINPVNFFFLHNRP